MRAFVLRRLFWFVLTVWAVLTVSFFLMHAVPGGPFSTDRAVDPIVEHNLAARYHLDWPVWRPYLHYTGPFNLDELGLFGDRSQVFGGLLTGDLGPSFRYRDYTVNGIIAQSLPISLRLGALALVWALGLGLLTGIVSAVRPRSKLDQALRLASTAGIALPNFVIAGLLLLSLAFTVNLFPVAWV